MLICTYRRPESLSRGLSALAKQERQPDDVLVVARHDDVATLEALALPQTHELPLRLVTVKQPGTVHALNTGLDACRTDMLAITDDDTVPHLDWLSRIMAHFGADPALGGVGGRDWCHDGERFDDRSEHLVGRLQWFGRTIGNHHLGIGLPQEVNFLKGANMAYRAQVFAKLRFDARLRGSGAQPYEDVAFSLAVHKAGWKLLYDPRVAVDHYAATREEPRHYVGVTAAKDSAGLFDFAYNEVIGLWQAMSVPRRVVYIIWSMLVGTSVSPGMVQAIRFTPRLGWRSWGRFMVIQKGKLAALKALCLNRQVGLAAIGHE